MRPFVTISKLAVEFGYSERAVRAQIDRRDSLQDQAWVPALYGRIFTGTEGYERWRRGIAVSGRRQRAV